MDRAPHFLAATGWMQSATLARVVSLDDPESRNRVQVRLFALDGADQQDAPLWARVVCPFAGDQRGAFFMPDIATCAASPSSRYVMRSKSTVMARTRSSMSRPVRESVIALSPLARVITRTLSALPAIA